MVALFIMMAQGCYYDNEEYLYADAGIGNTKITYDQHIQSIMNSKCATAGCHVAGTGVVALTTYEEVSAIAINGKMRTRVLVDQNMPPTGPLPTAERAMIQKWIETGNPKN